MPFISYIDLENKTSEACRKFQQIEKSIYSNDKLGRGRNFEEFMECDCREQWEDGVNTSCGEHSDCINRLTQIECVNDRCSQCGLDCQNQRFQKREYAPISIIQTEHKGYGVIAQKSIPASQFIIEYIGEVITEQEFNQRMIAYDQDVEKRKHFYFMMLQKGEFIDATTKGCLARFCNHSCQPNAYVSKWVVNGKLRMGIFAKKDIQRGEEITFDYNVDRYGAKAQKCYCGEPNCIGVLGGKIQTEATNLLPDVFLSALGTTRSIEKKFRQSLKNSNEKIKNEVDEEGINKDFLKTLEMTAMETTDEVSKVIAALLQTRSEALCVKLTQRVVLTKEESLKSDMIKFHGYSAFCNVLDVLRNKHRYVKILLKYLLTLPTTFKDSIQSSRIDKTVKDLGDTFQYGEVLDLEISKVCQSLLEKWSTFKIYKRIQKLQSPVTDIEKASGSSRRSERRLERQDDFRNTYQPISTHPPNNAYPYGSAKSRQQWPIPLTTESFIQAGHHNHGAPAKSRFDPSPPKHSYQEKDYKFSRYNARSKPSRFKDDLAPNPSVKKSRFNNGESYSSYQSDETMLNSNSEIHTTYRTNSKQFFTSDYSKSTASHHLKKSNGYPAKPQDEKSSVKVSRFQNIRPADVSNRPDNHSTSSYVKKIQANIEDSPSSLSPFEDEADQDLFLVPEMKTIDSQIEVSKKEIPGKPVEKNPQNKLPNINLFDTTIEEDKFTNTNNSYSRFNPEPVISLSEEKDPIFEKKIDLFSSSPSFINEPVEKKSDNNTSVLKLDYTKEISSNDEARSTGPMSDNKEQTSNSNVLETKVLVPTNAASSMKDNILVKPATKKAISSVIKDPKPVTKPIIPVSESTPTPAQTPIVEKPLKPISPEVKKSEQVSQTKKTENSKSVYKSSVDVSESLPIQSTKFTNTPNNDSSKPSRFESKKSRFINSYPPHTDDLPKFSAKRTYEERSTGSEYVNPKYSKLNSSSDRIHRNNISPSPIEYTRPLTNDKYSKFSKSDESFGGNRPKSPIIGTIINERKHLPSGPARNPAPPLGQTDMEPVLHNKKSVTESIHHDNTQLRNPHEEPRTRSVTLPSRNLVRQNDTPRSSSLGGYVTESYGNYPSESEQHISRVEAEQTVDSRRETYPRAPIYPTAPRANGNSRSDMVYQHNPVSPYSNSDINQRQVNMPEHAFRDRHFSLKDISVSNWKHYFVKFVPNIVFKELYHQGLPQSVCKKVSREFIRSLVDNEIQRNNLDPPPGVSSSYKKYIMDSAALYISKKRAWILDLVNDNQRQHSYH